MSSVLVVASVDVGAVISKSRNPHQNNLEPTGPSGFSLRGQKVSLRGQDEGDLKHEGFQGQVQILQRRGGRVNEWTSTVFNFSTVINSTVVISQTFKYLCL